MKMKVSGPKVGTRRRRCKAMPDFRGAIRDFFSSRRHLLRLFQLLGSHIPTLFEIVCFHPCLGGSAFRGETPAQKQRHDRNKKERDR